EISLKQLTDLLVNHPLVNDSEHGVGTITREVKADFNNIVIDYKNETISIKGFVDGYKMDSVRMTKDQHLRISFGEKTNLHIKDIEIAKQVYNDIFDMGIVDRIAHNPAKVDMTVYTPDGNDSTSRVFIIDHEIDNNGKGFAIAERYDQQQNEWVEYNIDIDLNDPRHYAGTTVDEDGNITYTVIGFDGDNKIELAGLDPPVTVTKQDGTKNTVMVESVDADGTVFTSGGNINLNGDSDFVTTVDGDGNTIIEATGINQEGEMVGFSMSEQILQQAGLDAYSFGFRLFKDGVINNLTTTLAQFKNDDTNDYLQTEYKRDSYGNITQDFYIYNSDLSARRTAYGRPSQGDYAFVSDATNKLDSSAVNVSLENLSMLNLQGASIMVFNNN
ncbi:MAG: hypothetical protein AAFZ92_09195, partial [Pseudomonadota bacterium]